MPCLLPQLTQRINCDQFPCGRARARTGQEQEVPGKAGVLQLAGFGAFQKYIKGMAGAVTKLLAVGEERLCLASEDGKRAGTKFSSSSLRNQSSQAPRRHPRAETPQKGSVMTKPICSCL